MGWGFIQGSSIPVSPRCPPTHPMGRAFMAWGGSHPAGLSSFQQSVAMDRIQRIIGVLQKPEMG